MSAPGVLPADFFDDEPPETLPSNFFERGKTKRKPAALPRMSDPGYRSVGPKPEVIPSVQSPTLRRKRAAEIENRKPRKAFTSANVASEVNEATSTLAQNIRDIPGVGFAERLSQILPWSPARLLPPSEAVAGLATAPLHAASNMMTALDPETPLVDRALTAGQTWLDLGLPGVGRAAKAIIPRLPIKPKPMLGQGIKTPEMGGVRASARLKAPVQFDYGQQPIGAKRPPAISGDVTKLGAGMRAAGIPEKQTLATPKEPIAPLSMEQIPSAGQRAEDLYVDRNIGNLVNRGIDPSAADAQLRTKFRNSGLRETLDQREGASNASQIPETGQLHEPLPTQPVQGKGKVPPAQSGAGVQQGTGQAPPDAGQTAPGVGPKVPPGTSVALRESEKRGMLPDPPEGVRSDMDLAREAESAGHGTQEGAAKLFAESKSREMSDAENYGLGVRLAAIDTELEAAATGSPEYRTLIDEAKALRGIRGTETARALRARGVLAASDYSPAGFVSAIETKMEGMGRKLSVEDADRYRGMARKYKAATAEVDRLQAELDRLRAEPEAKATKAAASKIEKIRQSRSDALKEMMSVLGRASMNIPIEVVRPAAKIVKSFIDEGGLPLREALDAAKAEIQAMTGVEFATKDLHEAYLGYRSPLAGTKRTVTEQLLWERRQGRRIRTDMDRELASAGRTTGTKVGSAAASASVEMRLWNPVARLIDQGANASEAIVSASSGAIERPIANVMAKVLGDDSRWARVPLKHKSELLGRYAADVKAAWAEAKNPYETTGPATRFAGQLDAPARAWHNLAFAAERAEHLSKTKGWEFGEVLDQIRDPYAGGPLSFEQARMLNEEAGQWADIQMLTNANIVSKGRDWVKMGIANTSLIKPSLKPAANLAVDITTTFGKVLTNVADKTAQYSNPYFAIARGIYELLPESAKASKSGISRAVRIRNFAQIAKRGGLGMALTSLGYQIYHDPEQRNGPIGAALNALGVSRVDLPSILGPVLVQGLDKSGKRTGSVWQDEGYIAQFGGVLASIMNGYRSAQIDASSLSESQKAKLRWELRFAPITDNPVATNVKRSGQMFLSGEKEVGDTLADWAIGLYYPGAGREWARIQQAQEDVYGRRAGKMFEKDAGSFWERLSLVGKALAEQVQRRTPYLHSKLPPRAVPYSKPAKKSAATKQEKAIGFKLPPDIGKDIQKQIDKAVKAPVP